MSLKTVKRGSESPLSQWALGHEACSRDDWLHPLRGPPRSASADGIFILASKWRQKLYAALFGPDSEAAARTAPRARGAVKPWERHCCAARCSAVQRFDEAPWRPSAVLSAGTSTGTSFSGPCFAC